MLLEVDSQPLKDLMSEKKIYIKYDRCVVHEKINVRRCFKCLGYNHNQENCTSEKICLKCGENDHEIKSCKSQSVKCENCYRAKVKTNFDNIDFNHDVKSIDCPVYKRQLLLKKKQN